MNSRQKNLLNLIISRYIKTAEPVGSEAVTEIFDFGLSPATIRNEMAELEKNGYLFQPHTSAGRVPTEAGFHYYIQNFLKEKPLSKKEEELIVQIVKRFRNSYYELLKNLAKTLAELTEEMVLVGFSENNFYYTGFSNLFSQPEFSEPAIACRLGEIIDHFDEVINKIFSKTRKDTEILVGRANPFGQDCGAILAKYQFKKDFGLLGIVGPLRMDYASNLTLIKKAQKLLINA